VALDVPGGEVRFCGGTWYARLRVEADVTISGEQGAVVHAGEVGSALRFDKDGITVDVRGLTLTGGVATQAVGAGGVGGGGVLCSRSGGATLNLEDVVITGNDGGNYGGGMYVDGCTVTMNDVTIEDNTAEAGAGLFVMGTTATQVRMSGSAVSDNAASLGGGGIYVVSYQADASVALEDTLVSGNSSGYGGGGATISDSSIAGTSASLSCTSTGAGPAGFLANTAADATLPGGGAFLISRWGNPVSFTSTGCDFGADGSADDNAPNDVFVYGGSAYDFGDGATFGCTSGVCR
jgi:hypothetical protein